MSIANAQDVELLRMASESTAGIADDPKAILEHFDMREKQQNVTAANHNMQI